MEEDSENPEDYSSVRVELPSQEDWTFSQRQRDRLFYSLVLGLIEDYGRVVVEGYEGNIPELEDPREVPGAHGTILTYNCTFGENSIYYYDAGHWSIHDDEKLEKPISIEDIPTKKEDCLEFLVKKFYGDNARIFEDGKLIYTSAKIANIWKLERQAKKVLKSQHATSSDLLWHCIGGAKLPDERTGKYGTRTLASFAAAYFAGGYVYMKDTSRKNEVSPGQVYEFGFDGLERSVRLDYCLDAAEEDCLDLDTLGGFDNVCLILTEYGTNAQGQVHPENEFLLTENDVLYLQGGSLDEGTFWERFGRNVKDTGKKVRRKLRKAKRNIK